MFKVKVTLLDSANGGRAGPLPPSRHSCIALVNNEHHDCRITYPEAPRPRPGDEFDATLVFLFPDRVRSALHVGMTIDLFERAKIGLAEILSENASDQ